MANEVDTSRLLGVDTIFSTVGKAWGGIPQTAAQYGPALLPAALDRPAPSRRGEH